MIWRVMVTSKIVGIGLQSKISIKENNKERKQKMHLVYQNNTHMSLQAAT